MILQQYEPCAGMNCGCTDGTSHSKECIAQHTAACANGFFGKWLPIETAPRDGSEFMAAYGHQSFVKRLANWNTLHGYWESKGEWLPGFEANATHWMPLPPPPNE